jgi:SAM-dependent methyltransferase
VTFLNAPFEDCEIYGPFDAVIGSSILHHLDCSRALPKIFRLLKPGGHMSFCEPNLVNPQIWITLTFRRFFPWMSPDESAFTRAGLSRSLACAGFTEITVEPFDWLHPRVPESLIPAVKRAEGLVEKLPVLRRFAGSLWCAGSRPHEA